MKVASGGQQPVGEAGRGPAGCRPMSSVCDLQLDDKGAAKKKKKKSGCGQNCSCLCGSCDSPLYRPVDYSWSI